MSIVDTCSLDKGLGKIKSFNLVKTIEFWLTYGLMNKADEHG